MTSKTHRMTLNKRDDFVREITVRNGTIRLSSGVLGVGVGLGIAKHKLDEVPLKSNTMLTLLAPCEAIELGMALIAAGTELYEAKTPFNTTDDKEEKL